MNKLLGISLALIMLVGSTPLGFSEPLRVQLEQGMETDQIQCDNPSHVLVQRTNGNMACVSERTAEKMGWEIISQGQELVPTILTTNSKNNPQKVESLDNIYGVAPFTSVEFPSMVNAGEAFEITSSWQYFELNEDDEVDVQYTENDNASKYVQTEVGFTNDFGIGTEFISTDGYYLTTSAFGPQTMSYHYEKFPDFQNTQVHNESLKFKINGVQEYPYNAIVITIDYDERYVVFISDNNDGTFSLSTKMPNGNSMDSLLIESFNKKPQTERYDEIIVEGYRHEEKFVCEEDPECAESMRDGNVDLGPDPSVWDSLADFVEMENPVNVRELLASMNMTQERIEEFLEQYPELETELETQSFLPSFSFILPKVFADNHPSRVYVYGNILILDKDRKMVAPIGAKVCAVDQVPTSFIPYKILQYQNQDACKIIDSSSGSFGFFTDNKDYARSISPADLGVALFLDNEVVDITGQTFGTYSSPSRFFEDFSGGTFLNFKTVEIIINGANEKGIISAFKLFQYVMDANKFVENKFNKNIDKLILRFQDTGKNDFNFRATNYDAEVTPSVMQVGFHLVPYVYPTQHEYGHHFMNMIYKSNGGIMLESEPSCARHDLPYPEPDPKCVWKEGFAAFFPFMINQKGQLIREITIQNNVINTITYDIENRKTTYTNGKPTVHYTSGVNVEGNVASALLDIIDGTGEANTDNDSDKYDDLDLLHAQFFQALDTKPTPGDATMPQQSWTEYKKDWDRTNIEKIERVMYLNTLQSTFDGGSTIPDDTYWNIFFTEDFESGNLNKWINTGDDDEVWTIQRPVNGQIPGFPNSNQVIKSEDCDQFCTLTLKDSIDMRNFDEAKLQLYRFVDSSDDKGEGIIIEVSTNGGNTWTNLVSWIAPASDDNKWNGYDEPEQNLSLDSYLSSSDFKFRLIAKSNSNYEDNQIDNVRLLVKFKGGSGGNPPTPTVDTTGPTISITSPNNGQTVTSSSVTVSGSVSDPSGINKITISPPTGNAFVVNGQTSFSHTFTGLSDGSKTFTIYAWDTKNNRSSESVTITISIPAPQIPPVLDLVNNVTISEDASTNFGIRATDVNNDSITLSITNAPSWVTINDNGDGIGTVTINVPTEVTGSSYLATVRATDNDGHDEDTFRIIITEVNQDPILSSIDSKSVRVRSNLSFTVSANDADLPSQTLRYSMTNTPPQQPSDVPDNISLNSSTGEFSWTPTSMQTGFHSYVFTVTDGIATDSETVNIIVSAIPKSSPKKTLTPTSSSVSHSSVTISWNAPDSGSSPITEYDIFRSASPKVLIATVPATQLSYTDDTVLPSTTYQYTISAKNQYGSGEESEPITVTTADDIPTHPTDAFATYSSLDIAVPLNHDTSLPLLVTIKLDNPDTVRDDVLDILLVQNDIVLPHVVESWDATDGSLSIWVLPLDTTNMILQYGASPQYNDGKIWNAFTHAYLILDSGADLAGNSHALSYNVSTTSLNSPYPDYTTPRTVTILFDMSDDDSGTLWNNGPHTSIYRDENISVNDGEIIFWLSHEGSTTYRISQNVTSGTHVASYSFSPSSDGITREFYVDGTLVGIDNSGITSSMAPDALFFGSDQDGAGFRNTGNVFTGEIRAVLYSDFVDVKKIHDTLLPSLTISNETSTNIVPQQHLLLEGYDSSTKITLSDAHGMTRISTSIQNPVFALNDGTILQSWNDNYNNNYWVNVPLGTGDIFAYSGINYTSNQSVWSAYNAVYFGDNIDVTGQNTMSIHGNPNFENGIMSFDGDDHLKNIDITNTILPLAVTALVKVDSDTVGPIWQLDTTTSEYHDEVLSIVDDNSTKSIVVNTNHFGVVNTMNHEISKGLHAFTFVIDTDNTRSLYVDGMLVQKDTVESLLPLVPNRMSIGADYGFKDNIFKYYTGEINAVLYSDTVPTDTEIKTLHSSLLAEEEQLEEGCYFDEKYGKFCPPTEEEIEAMKVAREGEDTIDSEEDLRAYLKADGASDEEIEEIVREAYPQAST